VFVGHEKRENSVKMGQDSESRWRRLHKESFCFKSGDEQVEIGRRSQISKCGHIGMGLEP